MNVLDAAYCTGRDYPGGTAALAMRLERPNLSDELNPNRPAAKLGLQTAVDMQVMSRDFRILFAMAAELDHMAVPLPAGVDGDDLSCGRTVALVAQDFAALMHELADDMKDNRITDNELKRIEKRWGELVAAGQKLLKQLTTMNAAGKAPRLRSTR